MPFIAELGGCSVGFRSSRCWTVRCGWGERRQQPGKVGHVRCCREAGDGSWAPGERCAVVGWPEATGAEGQEEECPDFT